MTISARTSSRADAITRADRAGQAGLVLFVLVSVAPIAFGFGYALLYSTGVVGLLSDGFTLRHWQGLGEGSELAGSFAWSVYIAAATLALTTILALSIALYLRRYLVRGPLAYLIYLPLAVPGTVAAFLVFQLLAGAGYVSRFTSAAGLLSTASFPELVQDGLGIGIILAHTALAVPFFVLLFLNVYDTEKVAALGGLAHTLGASPWDVLRRLTVPVLLGRSMTNLTLLFIAVLSSYEIPLLLDRQSPQMISVLVMRKFSMFDLSQKPEAFVVAVVYTLFVLALLVLAFRWRRRSYAG